MQLPVAHTLDIDGVLKELATDGEQGLSTTEAARRLSEVGPNRLPEAPREGLLIKLLRQFTDFLVILLIVATVISAALHEYQDAIVIAAILILNSLIGLWQEVRAEKAMEALKQLQVPQCMVIRDGEQRRISAYELVPGDLLALAAGDLVPADSRVIEAFSMAAVEAALTGESVPSDKRADCEAEGQCPLGDRQNMLFMGTALARGRGRAIVTTTGAQTELGKIASMLSEEEEGTTPLQRRVSKLGKQLGIAALVVCAAVFVAGITHGQPLTEMFMAAVSLAVAAIPEGLPAVIMINLALGAQRMAKANAIIRKLPAVETLGSITIIASDKTGTLTENKMTVVSLVAAGEEIALPPAEPEAPQAEGSTLDLLLKAAALCNDSAHTGSEYTGDPTEIGLLVAAEKFGYYKDFLAKHMPRVWEIPFDSDHKFMLTCHRDPASGKLLIVMKGATEAVLAHCKEGVLPAGPVALDDEVVDAVQERVDEEARRARRVLAFAYKYCYMEDESELTPHMAASNLIFLGYMAMIDPPRAEAAAAVAECKQAGIRPVMITGDHPVTAIAIASSVGIVEEGAQAITGQQLDEMDEAQLAEAARTTSVFARVSPEHKLKLIKAYRADNHLVSMTGDGVNDAPALKSADIGVAMGIEGTDVAKDAADMVLADDNFATIVNAVEQGRVIFDNITKFVRYMISTNAGEIMTMFFAMMTGMGLPLMPIHILWINLVTDGPPALALGVSPAEPDLMKRPPRSPEAGVLDRRAFWGILMIGGLMALGSLIAFKIGKHFALDVLGSDSVEAINYGRTMCFTTLVFFQLFHSLNCQYSVRSLLSLSGKQNPWLYAAFLLGASLQLAILYIPSLHDWFRTAVLDLNHLGISVGIAASVLVLEELIKLVLRVLGYTGVPKPSAA